MAVQIGELERLVVNQDQNRALGGEWYADIGQISLYYASRTLLPAKTRAFIELVSDAFRRDRLAERLAGSLE